MIKIRPIKRDEWAAAKLLVYRVAHRIFNETRSLEEAIADYDSRGALDDMLDIQKNYFDNGGIFLVMTDDQELIGTGAIRKFDDETCELKRLWFLPSHHGRGLGYQMIQKLLGIARQMGYQKVRLETDPITQKRAYDLYKRLGFVELPLGSNDPDDVPMEMNL